VTKLKKPFHHLDDRISLQILNTEPNFLLFSLALTLKTSLKVLLIMVENLDRNYKDDLGCNLHLNLTGIKSKLAVGNV